MKYFVNVYRYYTNRIGNSTLISRVIINDFVDDNEKEFMKSTIMNVNYV